MKHMQFIPKMLGVVLAAILLNTFNVAAQENTFAYNEGKVRKEKTTSSAGLKLSISQLQQDDLLFRVTVENPESEKLTLSIRDNNNMTLHQETLPLTLLYKGRFNLQGLEDGNYTFEIRKGKTSVAEKTIDIRTETKVSRKVFLER